MLGAFAAPLTALGSMMNNLIGEVSGLLQALADKTPDSPAPADKTDDPDSDPSDPAQTDTENNQ